MVEREITFSRTMKKERKKGGRSGDRPTSLEKEKRALQRRGGLFQEKGEERGEKG